MCRRLTYEELRERMKVLVINIKRFDVELEKKKKLLYILEIEEENLSNQLTKRKQDLRDLLDEILFLPEFYYKIKEDIKILEDLRSDRIGTIFMLRKDIKKLTSSKKAALRQLKIERERTKKYDKKGNLIKKRKKRRKRKKPSKSSNIIIKKND